MSEEQPVFKVTDRRLFNADGTPREVPPEEAAAKTPPAEAEETSSTESIEPPSAQAAPAEQSAATGAPETAAADSSRASEAEQLPGEDYAEGEIPGADDPTSFINFLMSIASNAAAALGMMEHPVTGQRTVDPELGKHWIDVLGMLQQKTRGNLAPQERQIFEGLLADLRMQYVSLTSAGQPKAPRGFKGSDITGGR